ncbi:MAG TPA: vWA domain-containing protein [Verrucomicrobiae bacterium]|jgi:hypothetical protein|nr:vWA domain-containing protein [Verrucomicrobiae bacterium]
MRITPPALALAFAIILGPGLLPVSAADEDGVALGILYDTSGSMKDSVPDSHGSSSPKYVIANRAMKAIVSQIQTFVTNSPSGTPRKIEVGLFKFGPDGGREVVKLGPFDAAAIQNFADHFSTPNGATPLGNALRTVSRAVLNSPMPRKHVLVITDGENTVGPDPSRTLPSINRTAEQQQASIFFHFIAFDVDAKVFNGVKKQGATVASAADERQLNSQLDFILQNQILLEKPAKTK